MVCSVDRINGLFELIGGLICFLNVRQLYKDKRTVGIYWPTQAFFASWGFWNLYYYPSLNQWNSFWGGVLLAIGNTTWVIMSKYYEVKNEKERTEWSSTEDC